MARRVYPISLETLLWFDGVSPDKKSLWSVDEERESDKEVEIGIREGKKWRYIKREWNKKYVIVSIRVWKIAKLGTNSVIGGKNHWFSHPIKYIGPNSVQLDEVENKHQAETSSLLQNHLFKGWML